MDWRRGDGGHQVTLEKGLDWTINLGLGSIGVLFIAVIVVFREATHISEIVNDGGFRLLIFLIGMLVAIISLLKNIGSTARQTRVDSASLMLQIESIGERNFAGMIWMIQNCEFGGIRGRERELKRFLNHLKRIAYLHDMKLVSIYDIRHSYRRILRNLDCDKNIQNMLNADTDGYRRLRNLCNKI